jgi:uncharacterized protein (DUF58 family)
MLLALVSCGAGQWRHELLLTLLGVILLAVAAYCVGAALILSCLRRKSAGALSVRVIPAELSAGQRGTLFCSRSSAEDAGKHFFHRFHRWLRRPPGVLVRYCVDLCTADGRRFRHTFDPDYREIPSFPAPERGAYYAPVDRLLILDILGLFQASIQAPQQRGERLLSLPAAAEEPAALALYAGGHEQRIEPHFQRTDDLIDHRPYIPGDDPRRINWKLYGHAGDLFIREGEPEPPPHSRLVILLDTEADPLLYGAAKRGSGDGGEKGRRAVDLLCEQALALIREYAGRGMDILVGYTGGEIRGGEGGALAAILAHPAAVPLPAPADLPDPPEDRSLLLLALPRLSGEASALDRFIRKRGDKTETALFFLYEGEEFDEAAETAARLYNRRGGVHARSVRV